MKRKAVFFDRDNTLIVSDGYLGDPTQVVLIDGAADALQAVRELGYATVVCSNQSGVARGMFSEDAVRAVNRRLDQLLRESNARALIDRHEYCPYHPTASVERYRKESDLRKPAPGMLLKAAREMELDLKGSWLIGDAPRDIEAGKAAGCRTILFRDATLAPSVAVNSPSTVQPDFTAATLRQAAEIIARESSLAKAAVESPAKAAGEAPGQAPAVAESAPAVEEEPAAGETKLEAIAEKILEELRRSNQHPPEFSVTKLLAGIVQVVVLAALFGAYIASPAQRQTILLVAMVLQSMTIALLIMGPQR